MSAVPQSVVSAARPFPGLRPFAYQDHDYFFGREDQIFALYRLIDRNRFIAVVGSSGCGKSSLVRAGLMPMLDAEAGGRGGHNWLWREMRPGDAPLGRLTGLLAGLAEDDDPIIASARRERVAAHLRRSSFGVAEALTEVGGLGDRSLVLVIDQFEELFRYSPWGTGASGDGAENVRAREAATKFVQLLLEATRTPEHKLHVMLTMRSDFIGDCARFHGLPEAVSATQYLVPSLTRDQLEEVVCKPVEMAGAEIEPELVERLLNDCSTELDQLPVLQHCLLRLWEEAGRQPAGAAPAATRRLTTEHYRRIGGFAGALSQHADELLRDLAGPKLQLAVEQTFRAVSELDKEGRATRRALRFAQLLAETGVEESELRRVLDRFRADDCSFLVPPHFEVPRIEPSTRIDVGHEALLRRWEKVSGHGSDVGWLSDEQQAGQRYRGLLAIAEGEGATLPAHLVEERWRWWYSRPHTPAWAERYGGGFERVNRLLRASKARQRAMRFGMVGAFIVTLAVAGAMGWLWWDAVAARNEASTSHKIAITATRESMSHLANYLNDGTITVKGARELLDDAGDTVKNLESTRKEQSPEIADIEITLLLYMSDAREVMGDRGAALDLARRAKRIAQGLLEDNPENFKFKHLVYASTFRIGDAVIQMDGAAMVAEAEAEYREALGLAEEMAKNSPDDADRQRDIAFIVNKVGDIHENRSEWTAALEQYQKSLEIAERFSRQLPDDLAWRRDAATAKSRIGQALLGKKDYAGALAEYNAALSMQTELLSKHPSNNSLLSNKATTYRRIGELWRVREDNDESLKLQKLDESQKAYQAAVDLREKLYKKDPANAMWRSWLATDQVNVGDVLKLKGDWPQAAERYRVALRLRQDLVFRDPDNLGWWRSLVSVQEKLGDALSKQNDVAGALQQYTDAIATLQAAAAKDQDPKRQQAIRAKIEKLPTPIQQPKD